MRHNGRVDLTQRAIVKALRDIGASVQVLSNVGSGCPDLLASRNGVNVLLECKSPGGRLTQAQQEWIARWNGQVTVVATPEEAQLAVLKVAGC